MRVSVMSIDTGLVGSGWAIWDHVVTTKRLGPRLGAPKEPVLAGVINAGSRVLDWTKRADKQLRNLEQIIDTQMQLAHIVVEWPALRSGDAVGMAAAGSESLTKLAFMCGMYAELARTQRIEFHLMPVQEWKGQLPKKIVEERITKLIGVYDHSGAKIESHAWDAVGIGLHFMGVTLNYGSNK